MLIYLQPESFCGELSLRDRAKVLEGHLRRSSDGSMKLGDYVEWLEVAGLPLPSRQTLRLDIERYASWCDDIIYGKGKKILYVNSHARRDAIRYFLGEPWVDSPLKPKLSSSVCRCLLLAMNLKEEVEFQYAALPKEGHAPTYKVHRGVPVRTLPGSDAGYMAIWLKDGRVFTINLTRVLGRVSFTGQSTQSYQSRKTETPLILSVQSQSLQSVKRCADQFEGGMRKGNTIRFSLPESMALMTADIIDAWWRRTGEHIREANRTIDLSGEKTIILVEQTLIEPQET